MNNWFLLAVILLFGMTEAVMGQRSAQAKQQTTSTRERDLREIERLEDEWNAMNEISDVEGKRRVLADDSYHVGPSGRLYNRIQDIEATMQSFHRKQADRSVVKFFIEDRRIRLYRDVAIVTATGWPVTTRDGQQRRGRSFRAVHVWEKRNGVWLLVIDQVTAVTN